MAISLLVIAKWVEFGNGLVLLLQSTKALSQCHCIPRIQVCVSMREKFNLADADYLQPTSLTGSTMWFLEALGPHIPALLDAKPCKSTQVLLNA